MSIAISLILFVVTLILYLYWYFKRVHRYFEDHGIPHIKPRTFLGNMVDVFLLRKPAGIVHLEIYNKLAPHKFGGFYALHKPAITIRDPELIKHVVTKDFAYFENRGINIDRKTDPLLYHLFTSKGEDWKNVRIKLTSTFTSGKMKMMSQHIIDCAEKLSHVLDDASSSADDLEISDLCARYTTDVIGSCVFGVKTHSLDDPNSEFRQMGKRIFEFRYQNIIRVLLPSLPQSVVKLLKLEFLSKDVSNYFTSIIENMVKYREENNITRYDFLDLLIALKNNTLKEKFKDNTEEEDLKKFLEQIDNKPVKSKIDMTVELLTAQCFLFFVAGFETSSTTLSFLFLELAQNKLIQNRVREEIVSVMERHKGLLTYDALKEMTYVDMVISETLRMYPSAPFLFRQCVQNYKIPDTDFIIRKGTPIIIPAIGLHYDKQYYDNPNEFNPENFTKEAIAGRHPYAYLPFGEGPRICIGERFAKMQIKFGLAYMLKNHEFELASKMKVPVEFAADSSFGLMKPKEGILLKCRKL